jgi:conjugal transfer mating pair stabilization protein TraG
MFEIYSIGDSAFLEAILNAVASVAGTRHYSMAAGVGALFGVLFTLLRGLTQFDARGIRYQDILASFLIYMGLFAPGVTVTIEDAYTGQVRVVDNVPFGPAAAGSAMSQIGYRLTRLFEQAFQTPTMTGHGYADSLEVLTLVRKNMLSRIQLGAANAPTHGADLESSVINFVKECTLTGIDLNLSSVDSIMRNPDVLNAIRWDSRIYTTEIYIRGQPEILECTDAWIALDTYIRTQVIPGVEEILRHALNVATAADVQPRIETALDGLTHGSVSAQNYMISALLTPMYEKGIVGRYEDGRKWTKAATVEQAIAQRNSQWATEQSLFQRMVRPMMTWIEGFTYAITPIMAFAVMLGARGIAITGQYFLMLLWIQLWMPILAIINLYINMGASAKFTALQAARFNLPSMDGLYHMDMVLQDWVSIGGMLASSTPAISLMLIYGGSITATHFLGRMQGGDFVDEKITSPTIENPAPYLTMQPAYQHAPLAGTAMSGAGAVLPTFQIGRDIAQSYSSASSALETSSDSFMSNLSSAASNTALMNHEGSDAHNIGSRIASSYSQTDKFMRQTGEDFAQRYRDTGISGDDYAALIGGAASFGAHSGFQNTQGPDTKPSAPGGMDRETKGHGLKGALSTQLQNQFHVGESRANEIASDIAQRVTQDHGWQNDLAESVSRDVTKGNRDIASLGIQNQDLSSLQHSAADLISKSRTYNETATAQSKFGSSANYGSLETGRQIAMNPQLSERLHNEITNYGLAGDVQRLSSVWRSSGLITDRDQSYAAAGVALLTGYSNPVYRDMSESETQAAKIAGYSLVSDAWNTAGPGPHAGAADNAGIAGFGHAFGNVRTDVEEGGLHDPRGEVSGLSARAATSIYGTEQSLHDGVGDVNRHHDLHSADLTDAAAGGYDDIHGDKANYFREEIHKAATGGQSAAEIEYDVVGGAMYHISKHASHLSNTAGSTIGTFFAAVDHARETGKGWIDAIKIGMEAAPEGGLAAIDTWLENETHNKLNGLTAEQKEVYKNGLIWGIGGHDGGPLSQYLAAPLVDAKANLMNSDPAMGAEIGELLQRAAGQNRPDFIDLVESYNGSVKKAH